MRIETSIGMGKKTFLPQLRQKFGLRPYYSKDRTSPLFVFGCGSGHLRYLVKVHLGFIVILWTGSDTLTLGDHPGFVQYLQENSDRIYNITFSHWCKTDLDHFGIPYQHRLIIPNDISRYKFEPVSKKEVYHYGNENRTWYYGTDLLKVIERHWDAIQTIPNPEFIYTYYSMYDEEELHNVYKDALLGVRLTEHDGIAGSVIEMGLMGRRTIYNDPQIPAAITYMSNPYTEYNPEVRHRWCYQGNSLIQTISTIIQEELENRSIPDKLLAEEMREFVYDDEAWLDTKYYEG